MGALLGGSEFLPERLARRPEIFETLFAEGGALLPLDFAALGGRPSRRRSGAPPRRR